MNMGMYFRINTVIGVVCLCLGFVIPLVYSQDWFSGDMRTPTAETILYQLEETNSVTSLRTRAYEYVDLQKRTKFSLDRSILILAMVSFLSASLAFVNARLFFQLREGKRESNQN